MKANPPKEDNNKLKKYSLGFVLSEVRGSYYLLDEAGQKLGQSQGYTMAKRNISFNYYPTDKNYEIMLRPEQVIVIIDYDEVVAFIKSNIWGTKYTLVVEEERVYTFKNIKINAFEIRFHGIKIGMLNTLNWEHNKLELSLEDTPDFPFIISAINAIAYKKQMSIWSFFY